MQDQHSYLKKLIPLGGEFITRSSLNLLPDFKVVGNTGRTCWSCLDELCLPASFFRGRTDSWVTPRLEGKTESPLANAAELGSEEDYWEAWEC